jgi:hypothetical protein
MKMVAEYLERALQFEQLTTDAEDAALKEQLLKQAAAYRKLAEKRAIQMGFPKPPQAPQT